MPVDKSRWQEVADKLAVEKAELDREMERQRMLDELSITKTRNYELEAALAKLAREQDRVALAERERILKRAQIAQATAVLVQEAQWAKARMEAEMRSAKQRAMVFPDTDVLPKARPTITSRVPAVEPADSPPIPADLPPRIVVQPAPAAEPASTERDTARSVRVPDVPAKVERVATMEPSALVVDAPPQIPTAEALSTITASVSETSGAVLASAGALGGMIGSAFGNVTNYFGESTQAEKPKLEEPKVSRAPKSQPSIVLDKLPESQAATDKVSVSRGSEKARKETPPESRGSEAPSTPQTVEKEELVKSDPPREKPSKEALGLVDANRASELESIAPKPSSVFPSRQVPKEQEPKKAIQQRARGTWTNMELHAEAGRVLEQLIKERDSAMQKKPQLLERLFAIPERTSKAVEQPMQPDWIKIADAWAKTVSVVPEARQGGKNRIDPVIASMAGVDPNISPETKKQPTAEVTNPAAGAQTPPPESAPATAPDDTKADDKKKKCVIM